MPVLDGPYCNMGGSLQVSPRGISAQSLQPDCNPNGCNWPARGGTAGAGREVKGLALPDFEGHGGTRWDGAAEVLNLARLPIPPRPHIQLL